jgi:hypothetical protein
VCLVGNQAWKLRIRHLFKKYNNMMKNINKTGNRNKDRSPTKTY